MARRMAHLCCTRQAPAARLYAAHDAADLRLDDALGRPPEGPAGAVLGRLHRKLGVSDPAGRDAGADGAGAAAKAWTYATICTVGSVIGGLAGYAIGYFLFELIGQPVLNFYGYGGKFQDAAKLFNDWGVWIIIIKGMTPFPYKVLTIASGRIRHEPGHFMLASIVARAMRFYLVAGLLYWFGEPSASSSRSG